MFVGPETVMWGELRAHLFTCKTKSYLLNLVTVLRERRQNKCLIQTKMCFVLFFSVKSVIYFSVYNGGKISKTTDSLK